YTRYSLGGWCGTPPAPSGTVHALIAVIMPAGRDWPSADRLISNQTFCAEYRSICAGYLRDVRVLSVRLSVSVMPTVHNLYYARCGYVEHSRYLSVAFAFYPMQMPDIWRASLLRKIVEIQQ